MAEKVNYYLLLMMITWMWLVLLLQNQHLVDSATTQEQEKEKDALLKLLNHTIQKPEVGYNWTEETDICKWLGVTCDDDNRVKFLNLQGRSFIGPIPNDTIGALTKLEVLSLPHNAFNGILPLDLSKLTQLRTLNLRNNKFNGKFPVLITQLKLLKFVDLSMNKFEGEIPCEIQNMEFLMKLDLENNKFTGRLRGLHLRKSVNFSVANNNITGSVPTTLSELPREAFDGNPLMCGDPLSSHCKDNITDQSDISIMGAAYCPPLNSSKKEQKQEKEKEKNALFTLLSRTSQKVEVGYNWTEETDICKWLGVTCDYDGRVKFLKLQGKSFIGPIPNKTIGALAKLEVLNLENNAFTDPLPSDLSKLNLLWTLNLQSNKFSDEFPKVITQLKLLQFVNLSKNKFKGQIPCQIQNMPVLQQLRLENNSLTGNIPGLNFRRDVDFSVANNNFTGSVPTTLSKYPSEAFHGNPLLCGESLSSTCINSTDPYNFSIMTFCPPLPSQPNPLLATFAMSGGAALFLLLFLIILFFPVRRKHRPTTNSNKIQAKSQSNTISQQRSKLVIFPENNSSWANGIDATEIMSGGSVLMERSLTKGKIIGTSYKVELLVTNYKVLVVKHLMDPEAVASDELDFSNKIEFLGKIRHENVMPLRGYCIYKERYLLIYDFIPGRSLYDGLHVSDEMGLMDWESRKRIALGAARGLAHLHTEFKLVHGNIKSSNILLYGEPHLDAYVADFGLIARPPTSYYGPETTISVPTNVKADVYAFGVLLLELLTGKSPDGTNLVQEVQGASDDEIWDSKMRPYDEKKKMGMVCLLQIAKRCTHEAADERPEMEKVARMIEDISGTAAPVEEQSHEISEDHPGTPPPPAFTP